MTLFSDMVSKVPGGFRVQNHGPGAVQLVGLELPEERAEAIGDSNLSTANVTSWNATGT